MKKYILTMFCLLLTAFAVADTVLMDDTINNGSFEFTTDPARPAGADATNTITGWTCVSQGWGGFWRNSALPTTYGDCFGVLNNGCKGTYTSDAFDYVGAIGEEFVFTVGTAINQSGAKAKVTATIIANPGAENETRISLGTVENTVSASKVYVYTPEMKGALTVETTQIAVELYFENGGNDQQLYIDGAELIVQEYIPPVDLGDAGIVVDWKPYDNGGFEFNESSHTPENGWQADSKRFLLNIEGVTDSDADGNLDCELPHGWILNSLSEDNSMGFAGNAYTYTGDLDGDGKDLMMFVNAENMGFLKNENLGIIGEAGKTLRITFGFGVNEYKSVPAELTPVMFIGDMEYDLGDPIESDQAGVEKYELHYTFEEEEDGVEVGLGFYLEVKSFHQAYLDGIKVRMIEDVEIEEGESFAFPIALKEELSEPQTLNVDLQSDSADYKLTEASVSPATLDFTENNWNVPQNVLFTSVDNALVEGDKEYWVTIMDSTPETEPNAMPTTELIRVVVIDDEDPRIELVPAEGVSVREGSTNQFAVKLHGYPSEDVTVFLADKNDPARVTFVPNEITFTVLNEEIFVTVEGIDNDTPSPMSEDIEVDLTSSSADENFEGLLTEWTITVLENDCDAEGFVKHPFDANGDCMINLGDFAVLTDEWLSCNFPHIEGCPTE